MSMFSGATDVTHFGAVADSLTDNTPAFMAALAATPDHGAIVIPPPSVLGSSYRIGSTITQSRPISWFGLSAGTRIEPAPDFVGTNIHLTQFQNYWKNVKFEGFTLGDDPNIGGQYSPKIVGFTRNGERGIHMDCAGGVQFVTFERINIGESGCGESLLVNGIGTQHVAVENSEIHGGVYFMEVADSCQIRRGCRIGGNTGYSRVYMNAAGGNCGMLDSTHVGAAGLVVMCGSGTQIVGNFFEQQPGQPSQYSRNMQLDIRPGAQYTRIERNIMSCGATSMNLINEGSDTLLAHNWIGNIGAKQAVYNTGSMISGPNLWNTTPQKVGGPGLIRNLIGQAISDAL